MPRWTQITIGISVVALSLIALYRLLALQYASGDAYPAYSSFRPDPLGTLALYEALASLPDTTTARNVTELKRAELPSDATLLFAGAQYGKDYVSTLERLEGFVAEGGRLVILFQPYLRKPTFPGEESEEDDPEEEADEENEDEAQADGVDEPDGPEDDDAPGMMEVLAPREDISERWGFDYAYKDFERVEGEDEPTVEQVMRGDAAPEPLPNELLWHSGVRFTDPSEEWKVVYRRGKFPVVMERAWGAGTIVLATDNFLVTNEALLDYRAPEYLTWLVGTSPTVIFDEAHLGVVQTTGLIGLLAHYRLIPILLVCILLTLLFIWRSAASLVPRRAAIRGDEDVLDAYSTVSGMANLTRRAVSASEALDTCWQLREQPVMRRAPLDARTRSAVEQVLAENRALSRRKKDPVTTYNRIGTILNERKPHS